MGWHPMVECGQATFVFMYLTRHAFGMLLGDIMPIFHGFFIHKFRPLIRERAAHAQCSGSRLYPVLFVEYILFPLLRRALRARWSSSQML